MDVASKFKYKSIFAADIKPLVSKETDLILAKASLESLKSIIPDFLKSEKNITLLPIAASLCNVNRANLNGDLIDGDTAKRIYKLFNQNPLNLSHDRHQTIGHLVDSYFCTYLTEDILKEDQIDNKDVYNICVCGVVYKVVNPQLIEILEDCANPDSTNYKKYSLSWEIGFNDFKIIRGSRNLFEAEIIDDPKEIERLTPLLDETGKDENGIPIYRYIVGEVYPLGAGIVPNPAGFVKGITTDEPAEIENDEVEAKTKESQAKIISLIESKTKSVIDDTKLKNRKFMIFKSLSDITDEVLKEATAASIHTLANSLMEEAVTKASQDYTAKMAEKDSKMKEVEAKNKELEQKLAETGKDAGKLQEDLSALAAKHEELSKTLNTQVANTQLNERMAGLKEKYTFDTDIEQIVAEEIKGMDEEKYAKWLTKAAIVYKDKAKKVSQTAVASVAEVVATAIEKTETPAAGVVNTPSAIQTLQEKWAGAFSNESVKVSKHKSEK